MTPRRHRNSRWPASDVSKKTPGRGTGTSRATLLAVPALPASQLVFFAILAGAFVLLVTEKLRNDVVAVLIVVALAVTGLLEPAEALSGFGSEPAIVVAAVFVLSEGLHRTGVSEQLGRLIGRWAGNSWARAIAVIMPSVSLISAFTHHLTTTAIMLPVTQFGRTLPDGRGIGFTFVFLSDRIASGDVVFYGPSGCGSTGDGGPFNATKR